MSSSKSDPNYGIITDEDIELQRLLIGVDEVNRGREFHSQVFDDAIRNYALSIGDDNPLYCDALYGQKTSWSSQIAPQIMTAIINTPLLGKRIDKELRKKTAGVFKGCQTFVSGGTWHWYRPIKPGDRLYSFEGEESMEVKDSEFGGRSVHIVHRYVKFNQRAEVVGVYRMLRILSDRKAAREKGKYKDIELGNYSPEEIVKFDEAYLQEKPRGATQRLWSEVNEGDEVSQILKGPLTMTDIILCHCAGYGLSPYRMLATSRVAAKDRARMPTMYFPDARGAMDTAARVHWDSEAAKRVGNPEAYDWGLLREFWLYHAVSDWMGDDAFVVSMQDEIRRFNYLGDSQTISGSVIKKYRDAGLNLVDLEMKAINQRGEETATATATISLPNSAGAAGQLPEVPAELHAKAAQFMQAHQALWSSSNG